MDNYKLTVTFSDGSEATEKFMTEQGMERAIQSWKDIEAEDRKNGDTYTIVSFEMEELEPAEM